METLIQLWARHHDPRTQKDNLKDIVLSLHLQAHSLKMIHDSWWSTLQFAHDIAKKEKKVDGICNCFNKFFKDLATRFSGQLWIIMLASSPSFFLFKLKTSTLLNLCCFTF